MKLEDLITRNRQMEQKSMQLQGEVEELQKILQGQQELQKALQNALDKPLMPHRNIYPSLPHKVQLLISEIAAVEEEISYLEERVRELRLSLHHEQKQTEESITRNSFQQRNQHHRKSSVAQTRSEPGDLQRSPLQSEWTFSWSPCSDTRAQGCGSNFHNLIVRENEEGQRCHNKKVTEVYREKPNQLSEELVKCLISIFLRLNRGASPETETAATFPKIALSCMSSRSFSSKPSLNSRTPISLSNVSCPLLDPYNMVVNHDCIPGDFGPYKNFIQLTRNSLKVSHMPHCMSYLEKLRNLMNKLCTVDLRFMTYKEKLAFWINAYNACFMHAFLRYGLPSAPEKLLALMNKAALNVGGIVLNAMAIEHFILRHPSKFTSMDEKQKLLRHVYGLGYPEPNVVFALCRGSCSSPAVRVYTAENVMSELATAKAEYLQASIGVTSKRKIVVPKLLQWYMHDFADDLKSLLKWICSQLPRTAPLTNSIMECLKGERKWPIQQMVEVQPYEPEFRYILAL
ncbi:uncharacterized protein LOC116254095 isoform X3 [Nymphaea colorata]|uniref:uncharacterized protein LOC116254095 isoform X3 n=1 Tax=Nymphaea colorata TaxID=210225 RepID=UPI00214F08EA|nr:uncharacterized protein LOC116254095 isoform X3 [Nymphaea colorata]